MTDIPIQMTFQILQVFAWIAFTFLIFGLFKAGNHLLKKYFDA